jgi:putative sterol carrier protein
LTVARFLSPQWVEEFNEALSAVVVAPPGPDATLATAGGRFTVVQEVRDGPDGDVRLILRVDQGSLRVQLDPLMGESEVALQRGDPERVDVTISLSYEAASAMSSGRLSPAEALNAGQIKVRGDLSVLVATQEMLAAARTSTQAVGSSTTY